MSLSSRMLLIPFVVSLLALGACGASGAPTGGGSTIDTTGWQTYHAPHFSVSLAPNWHEQTIPLKNTTAARSAAGYAFFSPDGKQEVAVIEEDGVTSTAVKGLCAANGTRITVAGLPMIYVLASNGVRNYTFINTQDIVYTLVAEGPAKEPRNQDLYNAVMATFKPDTTTSAC